SRPPVGSRGLPACHARPRADAARGRRAAGAGPTTVDRTAAPTRTSPRQVRPDRCARGRTGFPAGAATGRSASRRGDAAGAEAARRPPRRPGCRAAPLPAAAGFGTCTSSTRTLAVPLGALDRAVWLDRLGRQFARREQTTQVRIARDLVGRCRTLTRSIGELDRELHARTAALAPRLLQLPGCGPLSAAKLLCEIGPIDRFPTDA